MNQCGPRRTSIYSSACHPPLTLAPEDAIHACLIPLSATNQRPAPKIRPVPPPPPAMLITKGPFSMAASATGKLPNILDSRQARSAPVSVPGREKSRTNPRNADTTGVSRNKLPTNTRASARFTCASPEITRFSGFRTQAAMKCAIGPHLAFS